MDIDFSLKFDPVIVDFSKKCELFDTYKRKYRDSDTEKLRREILIQKKEEEEQINRLREKLKFEEQQNLLTQDNTKISVNVGFENAIKQVFNRAHKVDLFNKQFGIYYNDFCDAAINEFLEEVRTYKFDDSPATVYAKFIYIDWTNHFIQSDAYVKADSYTEKFEILSYKMSNRIVDSIMNASGNLREIKRLDFSVDNLEYVRNIHSVHKFNLKMMQFVQNKRNVSYNNESMDGIYEFARIYKLIIESFFIGTILTDLEKESLIDGSNKAIAIIKDFNLLLMNAKTKNLKDGVDMTNITWHFRNFEPKINAIKEIINVYSKYLDLIETQHSNYTVDSEFQTKEVGHVSNKFNTILKEIDDIFNKLFKNDPTPYYEKIRFISNTTYLIKTTSNNTLYYNDAIKIIDSTTDIPTDVVSFINFYRKNVAKINLILEFLKRENVLKPYNDYIETLLKNFDNINTLNGMVNKVNECVNIVCNKCQKNHPLKYVSVTSNAEDVFGLSKYIYNIVNEYLNRKGIPTNYNATESITEFVKNLIRIIDGLNNIASGYNNNNLTEVVNNIFNGSETNQETIRQFINNLMLHSISKDNIHIYNIYRYIDISIGLINQNYEFTPDLKWNQSLKYMYSYIIYKLLDKSSKNSENFIYSYIKMIFTSGLNIDYVFVRMLNSMFTHKGYNNIIRDSIPTLGTNGLNALMFSILNNNVIKTSYKDQTFVIVRLFQYHFFQKVLSFLESDFNINFTDKVVLDVFNSPDFYDKVKATIYSMLAIYKYTQMKPFKDGIVTLKKQISPVIDDIKDNDRGFAKFINWDGKSKVPHETWYVIKEVIDHIKNNRGQKVEEYIKERKCSQESLNAMKINITPDCSLGGQSACIGANCPSDGMEDEPIINITPEEYAKYTKELLDDSGDNRTILLNKLKQLGNYDVICDTILYILLTKVKQNKITINLDLQQNTSEGKLIELLDILKKYKK